MEDYVCRCNCDLWWEQKTSGQKTWRCPCMCWKEDEWKSVVAKQKTCVNAMLYGLETVAMTKRQDTGGRVQDVEILFGVTRMERISNEHIWGTAKVRYFRNKVRETRLRWLKHVQRRDHSYVFRKMLQMKLPGTSQRGRPKRNSWM